MNLPTTLPPNFASPDSLVRNLEPQQLERALVDPQRLQAVREVGLLDTPPEESFDRLTRLAANLLGVPATFISLVNDDRDFYKSCFGFAEPLASAREIEGQTFCHFAIVSDRPLIIPDTLADPVFREVPTVHSLGVRAYAGVPLRNSEGLALGSFCAIDFAPREWSALDIEILSELAASALREINLRTALAKAESQTRLAREATRQRERVLAVVAHDLRTPLNLVKMGAQFVAEDPAAPENPEMLTRMQGAIESMNQLIQDLLEVAKMENGQIVLHTTRLNARSLLEDAVGMLEPMAQRHNLQLNVIAGDELPDVQADYERILRVFSNLIVNAIKFSPAGTEIRVGGESREGQVRFTVRDSGPGISAANRERLFEQFWQGDGTDRRGAGLGLTIAKTIIQAHGGSIGVESETGAGSVFYFDLPTA